MKKNDAFPSEFVSKEDVEAPLTRTVSAVKHVTLKGDNGDERKVAVYFQEPDSKPMIINNVNWMTFADAYGEESDDWKGKRIELYKDPNVMFGNKRVGGVRVRVPAKVAVTGNTEISNQIKDVQAEAAPEPVADKETLAAVDRYKRVAKEAVNMGISIPQALRAKTTDSPEQVKAKMLAISKLITDA